MRKVKIIEVIKAYEEDIEILREDKKNSNRSKLIQRDELMLQFLRTVPADMYISCERTFTGEAKLNAGSLTECILNYHIEGDPEVKTLQKSGGVFDARRGCIDVEIKLSVNGSCYNTPIKDEMLVYLVNRDGVFYIKKADIEAVAPKGKLPFKSCEGLTMIKSLTKKMGYEVK